ncbi:MAG: ABC transporter ATP-binding protein [Bacteroidota bacterium]
MYLISANEIVKDFQGHRALDKVSVNVPAGSIYGLLGPNGAGKTTLIRIINQITAPDEGTLLFDGRPIRREDVAQIGYLPEERGLYKKMKVGEQALYLAQLKGLSKQEAMRKLRYWFQKFEITAWWGKKVEELSKGMQQKVQFITTVLHEPKLLIFDEPFSGFDPINVNTLKNEILELKEKGSTIIFSTHNMASVEELCDHITLINNSRTLLEGEITTIRDQFRTNTFRVQYNGAQDIATDMLNGSFELLSHAANGKEKSAEIRIKDQSGPNDLLKALIPKVEILSFNEILPSMNDIFIRVVGEATGKSKTEQP